MSSYLWRYFLEDDVESFRRFLAYANYAFGSSIQKGAALGVSGNVTPKIGSPGATLASSPKVTSKNRSGLDWTPGSAGPTSKGQRDGQGVILTRADVNSKDSFGRTLLHHASSSSSANAIDFVSALLKVPFLDLYAQDLENGWTALHRALYFGNITIAHALMARDIQDATDYTTSGVYHHAGGLIKIKDREGNSPFDVYGTTIASRDLKHGIELALLDGSGYDDSSSSDAPADDSDNDEKMTKRTVKPRVNLLGDEVFAFGSNKNFTLGLGDEDDRQYPERIGLKRPVHLLHRFHREQLSTRMKNMGYQDLASSQQSMNMSSEIPALIKSQTMTIQDVVMSKLHTAVTTNDPESNLFICGFGPGGRLGTGDETTRFGFVCIETGGLAGKKVVAVALGQDHSIAVSEHGEVFTWGNNKYGQLGYSLPKSSPKQEVLVQAVPRQIFGPLKKEVVIGAAASSIHSAVFTTSSLYTFGKNEGQLGLVDSDARSLGCQIAPRRVGVSLFASQILIVSAIDRATTCLLENHDVWVFTHYGYSKLLFPLESFTNFFLKDVVTTRYDTAGNYISKITSGGNTICAMSSFGEVFTVNVGQKQEPGSTSVSTTNPAKIRNALPQPYRVWSIRKAHMAVKDVDVGHDGSIIICTQSGSVWRKEKRAKIKDTSLKGFGESRIKDYKFVRIPSLTRAVAVRSNAFGAFTAARKDCDVTRDQIVVTSQTLWKDLFPLLPFRDMKGSVEDSETENPAPRFWTSALADDDPASIKKAILLSSDVEADLHEHFQKYEPFADSPYDLWITTSTSEVRIPAHEFMLSCRSTILRHALRAFRESYYFAIPEILSIEYGSDGHVQVQFQGIDFLTILNFIFYVYTENVIDAWHHTRHSPKQAFRYRQVRTELMKLAAHLEMPSLERAARVMVEPSKVLHLDMERAINDPNFFDNGDILVQLADSEVKVHSALLCLRCPFFDALFHGRAAGRWLSSRRNLAQEPSDAVEVDLKHIDPDTFHLVLRHIYADTGDELFDNVVTQSLDDFVDLVIDVMSVANELMLERLAQICQKLLGRFVNTRNVSHLLNAVAPCSVTEFKDASLEYICLNLEAMLENRLLDDLDEDLLIELDQVVRDNQLYCLPFAKSGRADAEMVEQHPELAELIQQARRIRIDSLKLRSRLHEDEVRMTGKMKVGGLDRASPSPLTQKASRKEQREPDSPTISPALAPKDLSNDLIFQMDDENMPDLASRRQASQVSSPALGPQDQAIDQLAVSLGGDVGSWNSSQHPPLQDHFNLTSANPTIGLPKTSDDQAVGGVIQEIGFATPSRPWGSAGLTSTKTDMKDILAQTSSTRSSNIGLGLSARNEPPGGSFGSKLSQKERKKLQQQQQLQQQQSKQNHPAPATPLPPKETREVTPKSPWQPVRSASQKDPFPPENVSPSSSAAHSTKAPPRSAMTLRQTVAGTPPTQSRSVSTPISTRSTNASANISSPSLRPQPTTSTSNPQQQTQTQTQIQTQIQNQPQVQSIRHTPLPSSSSPSSSTAQFSMADILQQQQTEKNTIKEAVAKRSLQEIQQEQEFQEWWEVESRKVQEQAAMAGNVGKSGSGGGRGRGRGRGRGGGRGGQRGRGRDIGAATAAGGTGRGKGKETDRGL